MQDDAEYASPEEMGMYFQFDLVLSDVSAFLVDGDYHWSQASLNRTDCSSKSSVLSFLPVIDKCGVFLKLQQVIIFEFLFPILYYFYALTRHLVSTRWTSLGYEASNLAFQIRSQFASFPSTRLALRLPSVGVHFSPARYHRLMQVAKLFQGKEGYQADLVCPWDQADFEGWLYHLTWKVTYFYSL